MEQEPHIQPTVHEPSLRYHGFWPVLLMGVSLLLIFIWEIWIGLETRRSAQQLQEQQLRVTEQATQVQAGLEKLVRSLVDLGRTDPAAQQLVTKFGIKVNSSSSAPRPAP